jgi:pilus assembly protein Flp/PilA
MRRTTRTEDGASAVEYSLIVAAIAGLVVLIAFVFGAQVTGLFSDTCTSVAAQAAPAETCS